MWQAAAKKLDDTLKKANSRQLLESYAVLASVEALSDVQVQS